MNEKKDKLQMIKEKTGFAMKVAKNVVKDPEFKKSVKDLKQAFKDFTDSLS